MNKGKVCVSLCPKTADEMIEKIKGAQRYANLIELRCDRLDPSEIGNASSRLREISETLTGIFLLRFRSDEGGNCFHSRYPDLDLYCWGADLELGMGDDAYSWLWQHKIFSHHDFSGVPNDLTSIYKGLRAEMGSAVKIAVHANDAIDAIPLWHLLDKALFDQQANEARLKFSGISVGPDDGNIRLIPIAMGEAGKWTRILGLAHGAYLTYASLEQGSETADGQITAKDLIETYRVKELDKDTAVYGVLGNPVTTSLSPYIHNPAFVSAGINAVFVPLMVSDIDAFMTRMVNPETREIDLNFRGFAVTMPHKQTIMQHLDEIDTTAASIGAVNTVKIENGRSTGYNTDAHGFIEPLKRRIADLGDARVAVVGAGGAARACIFALLSEKANVTILARDLSKANALAEEFGVRSSCLDSQTIAVNYDIVVNATPVGMHGDQVDEPLFTAAELEGVKFVYDLVTGPSDTPLISESKKAGIPVIGGIEMLIAQAARQFEIWTGLEADIELMRTSALSRWNSQ